MTNEYDIGAGVTLEALFSKDGTPRDPTEVTLTLKTPDGEQESITTLEHPSTGHYTGDYVPDDHGDYYYRFAGTGALTAAAEGRFRVRKSKFTAAVVP
jgi:hypothetical protein